MHLAIPSSPHRHSVERTHTYHLQEIPIQVKCPRATLLVEKGHMAQPLDKTMQETIHIWTSFLQWQEGRYRAEWIFFGKASAGIVPNVERMRHTLPFFGSTHPGSQINEHLFRKKLGLFFFFFCLRSKRGIVGKRSQCLSRPCRIITCRSESQNLISANLQQVGV